MDEWEAEMIDTLTATEYLDGAWSECFPLYSEEMPQNCWHYVTSFYPLRDAHSADWSLVIYTDEWWHVKFGGIACWCGKPQVTGKLDSFTQSVGTLMAVVTLTSWVTFCSPAWWWWTLFFTGWQCSKSQSQNWNGMAGAKHHPQHEVTSMEPGSKSSWGSLRCYEEKIEEQPWWLEHTVHDYFKYTGSARCTQLIQSIPTSIQECLQGHGYIPIIEHLVNWVVIYIMIHIIMFVFCLFY